MSFLSIYIPRTSNFCVKHWIFDLFKPYETQVLYYLNKLVFIIFLYIVLLTEITFKWGVWISIMFNEDIYV